MNRTIDCPECDDPAECGSCHGLGAHPVPLNVVLSDDGNEPPHPRIAEVPR